VASTPKGFLESRLFAERKSFDFFTPQVTAAFFYYP
jgi:hypothetical protein